MIQLFGAHSGALVITGHSNKIRPHRQAFPLKSGLQGCLSCSWHSEQSKMVRHLIFRIMADFIRDGPRMVSTQNIVRNLWILKPFLNLYIYCKLNYISFRFYFKFGWFIKYFIQKTEDFFYIKITFFQCFKFCLCFESYTSKDFVFCITNLSFIGLGFGFL